MSDIRLVATGARWLGSGVLASYDVIKNMIRNAEKEIVLTAFSLTNHDIVLLLEQALDRGIQVAVYINSDQTAVTCSTERRELERFRDIYPEFELFEIDDAILHAKIIVVDGKEIYCGSANLSHTGMENNYELGLNLEDKRLASEMVRTLRKLKI